MRTLFFLIFLSVLARGEKISYWNETRKGTNFFNSVEKPERWEAAKKFGVSFVRLAPNKWLNGRPEKELGNFLLDLNESDLKLLKQNLDEAEKNRLKVVLTLLSVPEGRWKQHNHGVEDRGIFEDFKKQDTAISFWKELAQKLKGHPALVGYNLRNEPSPELVNPKLEDWYTGDYSAWYAKVKGTPADLNLFYAKVVKAIREVDTETPIVLDSGFYATAWGFKVLTPVDDKNVLYSFHMYEPYAYNSQFNKGKYHYPGMIPTGEGDKAPVVNWNKAQMEKYLVPIEEWQKKYGIASNRILVGEVGVYRTNPEAEKYLKDILEVLNGKKWHWAFYSFREDTWAGMDYELGTGKPGWKYWEAIEKGKMPGPEVYKSNSLSEMLKRAIE